MLTDQQTDADFRSEVRTSGGSLRPAGIFLPGVVFQRGRAIPVWGNAAPRARIEATLGEDRAVTFANDQGNFFLKLPPRPAVTGLVLTISDGIETCRIDDVAVGEVFLLGGQSNMEYDLAHYPPAEFPRADYPIRAFRVKPRAFPGAATDVSGTWQGIDDGRGFSAIGGFFAAKIADELRVPVGLVDVSRGGVGTETFVSEAYLARDEVFAPLLAEYEATRFVPERNPESSGDGIVNSRRLLRHIAEASPETPFPPENWASPEFDDLQWQEIDLPDSWSVAGYLSPGVFLFRRKIEIPTDWIGKDLTISLGACDRADVCYINGIKVGSTGRGNSLAHYDTVRRYRIPGKIVDSATLTIAVEVKNFCSICTFGGMVGPEKEMFISDGSTRIPIAGKWRIFPVAQTSCSVMEQMASVGAGEVKSYHMLYDNSLRPLENFRFRAALFYQGEANTLCHPELYGRLLTGVIRSWRNLWQDHELPIIVFDLPGFQTPHLYSEFSQWAIVRQQLLETTLRETGLPPVDLLDCGDVDQIHPPEKRIPGERAAAVMLAWLRGETPPSGAVFNDFRLDGERLILHFRLFGSPLMVTAKAPGIVGVAPDGKIVPLAVENSTDDELILSLPPDKLHTIAYNWCDNPAFGKLRTQSGLPVFPFRFNLK